MVDISYFGTYWTDKTAGHMQFGRFLECAEALIEVSFLTQVTDEAMRGGVLLDLILTNNEELWM